MFSALLLALGQNFVFSLSSLFIVFLGLINSLAVYCNFRAINFSLSKTSVLLPFSSAVAMALGFIFLNEIKFLNKSLLLGIFLCFTSAIFFLKNKTSFSGSSPRQNTLFIRWIVGLSVFWGIVAFFIRYFAVNGASMTEFIFCWYAGSFLGSILLLIPNRQHEKYNKLDCRSIFNIVLLALSVWLSFLLAYKANILAPLAVNEQIFIVCEIISPVIIGLFWFKEIKKISLYDIVGLALGLAGGIIIALGY
jgi:drug/metabolite transporter (DMT)-like permease